MPEQWMSIGGLSLRLEGGDSLRRVFALPGMPVFRTMPLPRANITIKLDSPVEQPEGCTLLHRFEISDGHDQCSFMLTPDRGYIYSFGNGEALLHDPANPTAALITPIADPSRLRFALWLAYCMTAAGYGRMPIHSSVVVCDGRAVMCLGESGTGKSTHTRLWLENIPNTHLLNDDSPILALNPDGMPVVYGSPWSGKTDCFRQERFPLAALLRLEQKPENTIRLLPTIEAFAALQPSCPPAMSHDERCLDMVVSFVSTVIQTTPVYRLGCLPDADAAQLSHTTIYGS